MDAVDRRIVTEVAQGAGPSRAALSRQLGVARSTVTLHVDRLLRLDLLTEGQTRSVQPGRPGSALFLGTRIGVGIGIIFQDKTTLVGVLDGYGEVLDFAEADLDSRSEPELTLTAAKDVALTVLTRQGLSIEDVRVVVSSIAAPVHLKEGAPSHRAMMPLWLHWPVRERLAELFEAVSVLENDANLIATGAAVSTEGLPLLYLHLSHGVGAGLVGSDGMVYRGGDGSAGEIGHIRLAGSSVVACVCGRSGCIGAAIGLNHVLRSTGIFEANDSVSDAIHRLRDLELLSSPKVSAALRSAGNDAGMLTAALVDAFNPRTVLVGGEVVNLGDQVIAAIRARVYTDALPGSTNELTILSTQKSDLLALLGAARTSAQVLLNSALKY